MKSDHRAIQNVFYVEGCAGIDRLIAEGCSHYSLKRALREIQATNKTEAAEQLEAHLVDLKIVRPRHKPTKPKPGQRRKFKIQKGRGTRYLRLPVDNSFPETDAGKELDATFLAGRIVITQD